MKSQQSSLMSVSEACEVLGDDCILRIVSGIVMLQTTQESPNQSYTKKQLEDLEKVCTDQTDGLIQAMKFVFLVYDWWWGQASHDVNESYGDVAIGRIDR